MRLGCKGMKIIRRFITTIFMTLFILNVQSVFAQVESSSSPDIEPLDQYVIDCAPKSWKFAEIFYSASRNDLYRVKKHLGNTYFRVHGFINTDDGKQFLKGNFYNANRTTYPTGLPIPKDRVDKYRKKNGFRSTWFVPSNQWLCFFGLETHAWLDQVREERGNE